MRLSQTDLFPVLTIVAGGLVGGLVSFSFLGSPADDVPSPDAVVVPSVTPELAVRVEFSDGAVVTEDKVLGFVWAVASCGVSVFSSTSVSAEGTAGAADSPG